MADISQAYFLNLRQACMVAGLSEPTLKRDLEANAQVINWTKRGHAYRIEKESLMNFYKFKAQPSELPREINLIIDRAILRLYA